VIAKADDAAPRGPKYAPTDESRAAQQEHLARLSAVECYRGGTFTTPDNLAKLVLYGAILELLAAADNRRIKIRTAVVAVVALLGMLGGYLAWDRHVRCRHKEYNACINVPSARCAGRARQSNG
jgi:hypothetical protein